MIDRVSCDDLLSLASEHGGAAMQLGAVVVLDTSGGFDPVALEREIRVRSQRVPRLDQPLVTVPWGCGRPVWSESARVWGQGQVETVPCPEPRGDEGLLALAAELVCRPLPRERPLWRAVVVTGVEVDRAAVVLVLHHVLADGVSALAILSALTDPRSPDQVEAPTPLRPRAFPSWGQLVADSLRDRRARLRGLTTSTRRLRTALRVLRSSGETHAAPSSLNQVTGRRRRFAVVDVDLGSLSRAAHAHAVTMNDVLLLAVASALHDLLAARGEQVDALVLSMLVSEQRQTGSARLGNHSGVVAVTVATVGEPAGLLRAVGRTTRAAKALPAGASTAVLAPLFRALASTGLLRFYTMRQHRIHTFVSNLRGPESTLTLGGCPVTRILPLSPGSGNVTVSFSALSYAGRLAVSICADPDTCPDLPSLASGLHDRLTTLGAA
ncbi:MAG: WS/DGAT domain-containing protein [Actinomycetota bacterium]|nr:WS/DGAT domain-containing protein [Actinomycetota bacterium]